jgi:hypothetical protein
MSKTRYRVPGTTGCLRLCALALFGCVAAFGQGSLVGNSPFMPSGGAAAAASGPGEAYELAGSSVEGSNVSVCIFERQAKHSQWIPVGGIADGIHVISYDAQHDKVVVAIAGSIRELGMRKATVASQGAPSIARAAPAPGSEPVASTVQVASGSPAPARTAVEEQREARMLVSDLLEIGVQQRKAYQDAKQKAASEPPAQPTN